MAETPLYGAFGDVESQSENQDDNTFGVYQLQTQPIPQGADLRFYGTSKLPTLEFVRAVQTGTKKYDPYNPNDVAFLNDYKNIVQQQGMPEGFMTPDEIAEQALKDTISASAIQVGSTLGKAYADPFIKEGDFVSRGLKSSIGLDTLPSDAVRSMSQLTTKEIGNITDYNEALGKLGSKGSYYLPALANEEVAKATGNLDLYNKLKLARSKNLGTKDNDLFTYRIDDTTTEFKGTDITAQDLDPAIKKGGSFNAKSSDNYESEGFFSTSRVKGNLGDTRYQMAGVGAGLTDFAVNLLQGEDPAKAAKSAIGIGLGTYLGASIGGPIGAIVGGSIGKAITRVICTELYRQNLMTKEDVLIDLEFTKKHLTQQHIDGYHAWAINVVFNMRKGKYVKFWKHIAQRRCNEIKYLMGKADKPDYLGKVYRKIFEPICYIVGYFKKDTDWSILYKGEKNGT